MQSFAGILYLNAKTSALGIKFCSLYSQTRPILQLYYLRVTGHEITYLCKSTEIFLNIITLLTREKENP